LAIFAWGCRSFDSISEEKAKLERARAVYMLDTTTKDVLEISYNKGGVDMSMHLFLDEHEFELEFDKETSSQPGLEMNGASFNKDIRTSNGSKLPSRSSLDMKSDMSKVLKAYNLAQTKFYQNDYEGSLASLDSSIALMPTSDAYALKGSILFVLKEYDLAQFYWSEAKKLNPEFKVPTVTRR
jgi:tetratricopeptide (TPR) repeat protein